VKVTAQLDLNRVTVRREKLRPGRPGGPLGEHLGPERQRAEGDGANGVTAAGNIPGQGAANGFQPLGSTSGANDSVTNYEISKSVRTEVTEPGTVKKLSVAVAVDGATAVGADGKPGAYTPRSAQEMQQIQDLVRAAVGFDQARGDTVTVVNVRFPREDADAGGTTAANPLMGFDKNDIMRFAELGIAGLVAILILFFAVRPLMKSASGGHHRRRRRRQRAADAGQRQCPVRGCRWSRSRAARWPPCPVRSSDQRINIARIEGQVKASAIKQVSDSPKSIRRRASPSCVTGCMKAHEVAQEKRDHRPGQADRTGEGRRRAARARRGAHQHLGRRSTRRRSRRSPRPWPASAPSRPRWSRPCWSSSSRACRAPAR
jgi:flagellar M-ring protein FliF